MNYDEQIIGLKRVLVDMQKIIKFLESEKDLILKMIDEESADITMNLKNVTKHIKRIYSALNPIEAKIFPAARAARRQATAIENLRATTEVPDRKKH